MQEGWHGLSALRDPFGRNGAVGGREAADVLARARARARAQASLLAPPVGIAPPSSTPDETHLQGAPEAAVSIENSDEVRDADDVATSAPRPFVQRQHQPQQSQQHQYHQQQDRSRTLCRRAKWLSALLGCLRHLLAWARRKRPAISGVLEWLLRLHLAVFYLDGRYANLAMRAVGARLVYTSEEMEKPRARYAILGVFLLVQVMGEAAAAGGRIWSPSEGGGAGGSGAAAVGGEAGRATEEGAGDGDCEQVSPTRECTLSLNLTIFLPTLLS